MNRRDVILLAAAAALMSQAQAGAWTSDSFGNDDAMDWANRCAGSHGPTFIAGSLDSALSDGYLEAPDGSFAVAAAEVVAAARGKPAKALPKELSSWLDRQQRAEISTLAPIAAKAVSRVLNGPKSELRELWQENKKEFPAWRGHMQSLIARLQ